MARRAILRITPELIGCLFLKRRGIRVIEAGLPPDTKFVDCKYNWQTKAFDIVYESEKFDEILKDGTLPILSPIRVEEINLEDKNGKISKK